jgi:hypothetical protein
MRSGHSQIGIAVAIEVPHGQGSDMAGRGIVLGCLEGLLYLHKWLLRIRE